MRHAEEHHSRRHRSSGEAGGSGGHSTSTSVAKSKGSSSKRSQGGGSRSCGSGRSSSSRENEREVDVFRNPTRLFELIDAGDDDGAIRRLNTHPLEASTWLVSRRGAPHGGGDENGPPVTPLGDRSGKDDGVKWRYLPLHLACLQPSPSLRLIRSILDAHPPAVRRRDRAGNLPVHYVCLEGTEDDWEVLQFLLDAYPESLHKSSGDGRTLTQLVQDMGNSDEGSLATNGTIVAKVCDFGLRNERRRAEEERNSGCRADEGRDGGHGHRGHAAEAGDRRRSHRRREEQQREELEDSRHDAADNRQDPNRRRSKSRAKSRGRASRGGGGSSRELRDPPPEEVGHGNAYHAMDSRRVEKKNSADSSSKGEKGSRSSRQSSKQSSKRSKSRHRRERTSGEEDKLSSSTLIGNNSVAVRCIEDEEKAHLQKQIRELEGKLDAALTERDVLRDTADQTAAEVRTRTKEIKALRHKLDDAMIDADECRGLADAERRRVEELEDALREGRDQCKELNGRTEELEGRCREYEHSARRREEEWEKELDAARIEASDDARRKAKVEALEVERGLRDTIESLENQLTEKDAAEQTYQKQLRRHKEESEENIGNLRLMNASLQDQIISTKSKSNELEKKLKETMAERDALKAKLLTSPPQPSGKTKHGDSSSRSGEIGERQKKLHREFNSLWSALQSMSKDNPGMAQILSGGPGGDAGASAESLAESMQVMTAQNEAREEKIKMYKSKLDSLERENATLKEEAKQIQKEKAALEEEVLKLRTKVKDAAAKESTASQHNAKAKAADARRLLAYETQIKELQLKNKSLRDKITKNNETYVAKVEELGEECGKLNDEGEQLRRTVDQLREECEELREKLEEKEKELKQVKENEKRSGAGGRREDSDLAAQRAQMSRRISSVAHFLVKIGDMQDRMSSYAAKMEDEMRSRRDGNNNSVGVEGHSLLTSSERKEMESLATAAKERGALLKNAVAVQKRELEAIAAEIAGNNGAGAPSSSFFTR